MSRDSVHDIRINSGIHEDDHVHPVSDASVRPLLTACRRYPRTRSSRNSNRLLDATRRNTKDIPRAATTTTPTAAMGIWTYVDAAVWLDGLRSASGMDDGDGKL
jgi:hypothetical protein